MKENDNNFPFDVNYLSQKHIIYDSIYNRNTPLTKYSKEKNIKCINGLEILLYQGVLQNFKILLY